MALTDVVYVRLKSLPVQSQDYYVFQANIEPYNNGTITCHMRNLSGHVGMLSVGNIFAVPLEKLRQTVRGWRAKDAYQVRDRSELQLAEECLSEAGTSIIEWGQLSAGTPYWGRVSRKMGPSPEKGGCHYVIHNPISDPNDGMHDSEILHHTTQAEVVEMVDLMIQMGEAYRTSPFFAVALTGKGEKTRPHFHGHIMTFDANDIPRIVKPLSSGSGEIMMPTNQVLVSEGHHNVVVPMERTTSLSDFAKFFVAQYNATRNAALWDDRLENGRWRILGFYTAKNNDCCGGYHIQQIWSCGKDNLARLVDPFNMW